MAQVIVGARSKDPATPYVAAGQLKIDQARSPVREHEHVRLLVQVVVTDTPSVQLRQQLVEQVEVVPRKRGSRGQRLAREVSAHQDRSR